MLPVSSNIHQGDLVTINSKIDGDDLFALRTFVARRALKDYGEKYLRLFVEYIAFCEKNEMDLTAQVMKVDITKKTYTRYANIQFCPASPAKFKYAQINGDYVGYCPINYSEIFSVQCRYLTPFFRKTGHPRTAIFIDDPFYDKAITKFLGKRVDIFKKYDIGLQPKGLAEKITRIKPPKPPKQKKEESPDKIVIMIKSRLKKPINTEAEPTELFFNPVSNYNNF